jgi:hypothetical protein
MADAGLHPERVDPQDADRRALGTRPAVVGMAINGLRGCVGRDQPRWAG